MVEEEVQKTEEQNPEVQKTEEQETEKKQKKSFVEWYNEHPKTVFAIRFVLWATFSAILPFIFIAFRYGIFTNESKISLSGWGIIAIVVIIVFIITLVKYLYEGMKPGLAKQCVGGVCKIVLPLVVLLLLVVEIKNHIQLVEQALGCVIVCELVGIPLNPFPEWLEKRRIEQGKEKAETLSDIFWDTFFKKKKDNE